MYFRILKIFLLLMIIPFNASAAEGIADFEVMVQPAEGQKSFSEGYFNVDSKPGQTLSLDFHVKNNSKEPIILNIKSVDAHTASEGGILYGTQPDVEEATLLSDLIEIQDSVKVAPGETEAVHFHLNIPAAAGGTLLGGIMLTDNNASENLSMEWLNEGGSNYTIEQDGQRLVAVKLNLPEGPTSGFSLDKAKFNDDSNLLTLRVSNGRSAVLENVQGTYTILDKDGESVISGIVQPFAMAPKSEIHFPIDLKGQVLEKGKYILLIKGSADKKAFFAEESFSVSETNLAVVAGNSAEGPPAADRESISRTIAIALAALFLLLPFFIRLDKREKKALT